MKKSYKFYDEEGNLKLRTPLEISVMVPDKEIPNYSWSEKLKDHPVRPHSYAAIAVSVPVILYGISSAINGDAETAMGSIFCGAMLPLMGLIPYNMGTNKYKMKRIEETLEKKDDKTLEGWQKYL